MQNVYVTNINNKSWYPQGTIAAPLLFNIFIFDQLMSLNTFVAEYSVDKGILFVHDNPLIVSDYFHSHLNDLQSRYRDWKIKETKTILVIIFHI